MTPRVLILEDDARWKRFLLELYRKVLGAEAETCDEGAHALATFRDRGSFDLVSVDLNLGLAFSRDLTKPGATAHEFLEFLAKDPGDVGIIVFTALPYDTAMRLDMLELIALMEENFPDGRFEIYPKPKIIDGLPPEEATNRQLKDAEQFFAREVVKRRIASLARTKWSSAVAYTVATSRPFFVSAAETTVEIQRAGPGRKGPPIVLSNPGDVLLFHTLAFFRMAHQLNQRGRSRDRMDFWEAHEFLELTREGVSGGEVMTVLKLSIDAKKSLGRPISGRDRAGVAEKCRQQYDSLTRRLRDLDLEPRFLMDWNVRRWPHGIRLHDQVTRVVNRQHNWPALVEKYRNGEPVPALLSLPVLVSNDEEQYGSGWDYFEIVPHAEADSAGMSAQPAEPPRPVRRRSTSLEDHADIAVSQEVITDFISEYRNWEFCPRCGKSLANGRCKECGWPSAQADIQ